MTLCTGDSNCPLYVFSPFSDLVTMENSIHQSRGWLAHLCLENSRDCVYTHINVHARIHAAIADERDSADRTVTPTRNKTKMKGFVEISTFLIHLAPKQKSNQWMHLSPFYTRVHGEWLRYAKSTSQFHWRFLFSPRWSGLPSKSPMSSRHSS